MSFLKNIFASKTVTTTTAEEFWDWFQKNERSFFEVVKNKGNVEKLFFKKLTPQLDQVHPGLYFLTGMLDENTVELVFTAEGVIKHIPFVEDLVATAPRLPGWKFTALKPPMEPKGLSIEMSGEKFNSDNLSFYANESPDYPDEIDITVIHHDLNESNKSVIMNGTYIYLDNYLGELNFATQVDNLNIAGKDQAEKELIPIEKLKDYLLWREKEFIEQYQGTRRNTTDDEHSVLEADLEDGTALIAVINTQLLQWDKKASHPWILTVAIRYDGTKNNGMPDDDTYEKLDALQNEILAELTDEDGYLNIGRQTARDKREIYFACKEFRKPARVIETIARSSGFDIDYEIYKDKYWQSFQRFASATV